jgi:hypothetical protein
MLARVRVTPLLVSVPPLPLARRLKRILSPIGSRNHGIGRALLGNGGGNLWRVADVLEGVGCKILRRIQNIGGNRGIAVPASEAVGA